MEYNFSTIEQIARKKWKDGNVYKVSNSSAKPKYYVLDMFPYPSGAGLHVGHPLGYIFSDIYARYKRMQGYNVLHPMGFDAFGLPAEQYAIQTGQHPAITTEQNINTYKKQFEKIGFSFDWDRQVSTCDPSYYKWTQWIFLQLYDSWYNKEIGKSDRIDNLENIFNIHGNTTVNAACDEKVRSFSGEEWKAFSTLEKQNILMDYRLAYQKDSLVNWCPALGTVLANDEIVNGVSERGGYPVEKKKMSQWFLRITAYAERLLQGLDTLEWTESMKDMQRNWIGKSIGAMVSFPLKEHEEKIDVFTTRVDTIFGVTFLVIAPEHELVKKITTAEYIDAVDEYIRVCASKSDIERQSEKIVSGQFTGAYVLHPFTKQEVPVYIADYVLAGYGTGAVMAVPSGDQRDYLFAKKYNLSIIPILDTQKSENEADATKEGKYINSDFINGLNYKEATKLLIQKLEETKLGYGKINYRMRDAGYSRQRYWGEPFPIYYDTEGLIHTIDKENLPVTLPAVDSYKPTGTGESPLANSKEWVERMGPGTRMETDTMPGYAGSSWYFLRYMDPQNEDFFVSREAQGYWQNVDLYVGGAEHAVGHLLYSRFWHKFLKDNGWVNTEEPFKKMVNQGMIQGVSAFVYRYNPMHSETITPDNKDYEASFKNMYKIPPEIYISSESLQLIENKEEAEVNRFTVFLKEVFKSVGQVCVDEFEFNVSKILFSKSHVDINYVNNKLLEVGSYSDYLKKITDRPCVFFRSRDTNFYVEREIEKMSKSKFNVVNPDQIIEQYGADCFRMYEMFLGPIDTAKPWDTNGISGVASFLRKFWRLFYDDLGNAKPAGEEVTNEELKILHKTIKKVSEDLERFGFNTCVSSFMIAVNDLSKLKAISKSTLTDLIKLIAPFGPHTAEVLWNNMGNPTSVVDAEFPLYDEKYLVESVFNYPVQINGKLRANMDIPLDMPQEEIQKLVLSDEKVVKFTEGKTPKKFIVVTGRIINVVV
ncbi:MAG: leucine--tRNA ligase [Bacteroidota bacterium]|nr:leucine--tRNA ligase [Bacteroidota bacterium]